MGLDDERKMLTGSGDPKEKEDQGDMESASESSAGSIPESSIGLTTAEEEEEEELVDPLTTVREQCEQSEKCAKARERLELCDERVSSRSHTEEDCTEELFDFLHARDHCIDSHQKGREQVLAYVEKLETSYTADGNVAHKLFNSLK